MTRIYKTATLLATAWLLSPTLVVAHGDVEKPMFVANSGIDQGRCDDPTAPCQTIAYALKFAGKGGQIRVAEGRYNIAHAEDVFLMIGSVVDVVGGYTRKDDFGRARGNATTLTGVPAEYRAHLADRGFRVIADSKSDDIEISAKTRAFVSMNNALSVSSSAASCVNGTVNGLPCDSVDLLSHLAFQDISAGPQRAADVWGYVDLNTLREYAIVGYDIGTAVIDVSDPSQPFEVGFVFGQQAVWRDIKVYQFYDNALQRWQAYAYVTTDGAGDGLFVIDLTELPNSIRRTAYVSDFTSAHNVYATSTDYGTGISVTGETPTLIIAGSDIANGRYRSYSLANPESPTFIGGFSGAGYMHDASSMILTDARKDTQCAAGGDFCEVLLDFNETEIEIWDVTNAASPTRLSTTNYANRGYVHSGWWSEDKQFMYVHDELDEQNFGLQTTLRIFSVSDLTAPSLVGTWTGQSNAIDHNGFVRGNRYYMSNYSRGLTVLDISDPSTPTAVGNLDTYPVGDGSNFVGAWGAYPFFHSGSIAISDIGTGLYMADDLTRNGAEGSLSLADASYGVTEGGQVSVNVSRTGGTNGDVGVGYELIAGSAQTDDFVVSAGTLNWADGDSNDKSFMVSATNDGVAEGLQHVLIRLIAPTGEVTLSNANTANLYIGDPGESPTVEFLDPVIDVAERGATRAIVTVRRLGSATGTATVNVEMVDGDATPGVDFNGTTSVMLNWADGDANPRTLEFVTLDDGTAESAEFVELGLVSPQGAQIGAAATVRINIGDGNIVNQVPIAAIGGDQSVESNTVVTLDGAQSVDPDGDAITFQWSQTLGATVTLAGAMDATTTFTAPVVNSATMLQFQLTVMDPSGQTDSTTTTVTVNPVAVGPPAAPPASSGGGGGTPGMPTLLLLVFLSARRAARRILMQKGGA